MIDDREAMQAALAEAHLAAEAGEVPIGAVVVQEGAILARSQNRVLRDGDPTAHAEDRLLCAPHDGSSLGNYRLNGCTLYVTLEPCAMCAGAMIHARLDRLVFAAADPKAVPAVRSLQVLNHPRLNHQMQLEQGILADEASELLRNFLPRSMADSSGAVCTAGRIQGTSDFRVGDIYLRRDAAPAIVTLEHDARNIACG